MEGIKVYQYKGHDIVHISAFAEATHHSYPAVRCLLTRTYVDEKHRPLRHFRDGHTVWIPVEEIKGYPFPYGSNIYHYDENGEKHLCVTCTYGSPTEMCPDARKALEVNLSDTD